MQQEAKRKEMLIIYMTGCVDGDVEIKRQQQQTIMEYEDANREMRYHLRI